MEFFTIGVYNSTEKQFFDKLTQHNIDTFCDIRQRRGVRGTKYAFVNSNKLQQKLNELGIQYCYVPELAPTTEIRALQKEMDQKKGERKRDRQELGNIFVIEYKNKILQSFNIDNFLKTLDLNGAKKIVLFCVEERPESCHRSIVSEILRTNFNFKITHL